MEAPRDKVLAKVREWLAHAEEDLRLATYALTMPGHEPPYRLIAYHAQQCAEKCLKALLVFHNVEFPYTHNIRRLLVLCRDHVAWADALRDAHELTVYAITTRYPGEEEVVTRREAARAIETAEAVRSHVRRGLSDAGLDL